MYVSVGGSVINENFFFFVVNLVVVECNIIYIIYVFVFFGSNKVFVWGVGNDLWVFKVGYEGI